MSTTSRPPKKRRRWLRWVFIILMVAGLVYVGLKTTFFLQDAQMSLGLNRTPGMGIDALLVNKGEWKPPADSILRPAQIHVVLRLVEACDSLHEQAGSTEKKRTTIAALLNEHLFDRVAYTWCRNAVWSALTEYPESAADSTNVDLLTMIGPRLLEHRRVFTDSLDRMILFP